VSGIIPSSVVTYSYVVDQLFSKYVNVSFPFRTHIDSVWFTADLSLLGGTPAVVGVDEEENPIVGDSVLEDSFRALKIAGLKAKNPKIVLSQYDPPSDWNMFFGVENAEEGWNADTSLKPTIWLGLPDDETAEVLKDSTTQYLGNPFTGAGFRSSTGVAPDYASVNNGYWYNDGWTEEQYLANRYKTDLAVMNPDEILSLFVYDSDGDWTDYDGTGLVTIHIAYSGVGQGVFPAAGKTPWTDWWND